MKAYQPEVTTNSSTVVRYAFMKLTADCACASMFFGKIARHTGEDRLALLVIFFNIIAIAGRGLVSLFADRVSNPHQGVRLSVLLLVMGFLWPVELGITVKVLLAALGSCFFHAFAFSSLLSRSNFRAADVGIFLSCGPLGLAVGIGFPFFGYLAAPLLMIAAAPSDRGESLPHAEEKRLPKAPKTSLAPLFLILLLTAIFFLSAVGAGVSFSWATGRKAPLLLALAALAGRMIGGYLFDRLSIFSLLAAFGGGAALLISGGDSRAVSLLAVLLLEMTVPALIALAFRTLPRHPGFVASLAAGASYLGYLFPRLLPGLFGNRLAAVLLSCGAALLISATSEILLLHIGRRAAKQEPSQAQTENES